MKYIVTTTINEPTDAILKFSSMDGWCLVIVGDQKTPEKAFRSVDCVYLSPETQRAISRELSDLIGWNVIQRRNMGFVWAYQNGAQVIASVDDDNIPLPGWGEYMIGTSVTIPQYTTSVLVDDPIFIATGGDDPRWHRGFPIQQIHNRAVTMVGMETIVPDFYAEFWNGDPDLDAIGRITYPSPMVFSNTVFPFSCANPSPFNSQNTFVSRRALKHFFMIPNIGRMDDIWASYYAQAHGCRVVYGKASVVQQRNEHNLADDCQREQLGYSQTMNLIRALSDGPDMIADFIPEQSYIALQCYRALCS